MNRDKLLLRAIWLRQAVRLAIAQDDIMEVCRLNRLADIAYLDIHPDDTGKYLSWARAVH